MAEVSWVAVKGIIEKNLGKPIADILKGTADDIKSFVMEISNDLLMAAKEGKRDLIDELNDQLERVAKKNKVAAPKKVLESVLKVIKEIAFKGIL